VVECVPSAPSPHGILLRRLNSLYTSAVHITTLHSELQVYSRIRDEYLPRAVHDAKLSEMLPVQHAGAGRDVVRGVKCREAA
jgi:hypothetical protein